MQYRNIHLQYRFIVIIIGIDSQMNVHDRNLSGYFTTDFPEWPQNFFDFTAEDVPDDYELAVQGTRVKVLDYNEEVEIVFQGTNVMDASEDHPMHLHGYGFYVVGAGYGNFDNETDPKTYNLVDPPEVNTVSLPKKGWAALRFKASNPGTCLCPSVMQLLLPIHFGVTHFNTNFCLILPNKSRLKWIRLFWHIGSNICFPIPGVWLWHCHLDRHYSWGMTTVFIVKNGGTPETSIREPPPYMPPCKDSALRLRKSDAASSVELDKSDVWFNLHMVFHSRLY